ncbi:TPA: YdcF family protein [Kluyvera intermedia]|nr:YdcF family protein [Kluyvera intermedia]
MKIRGAGKWILLGLVTAAFVIVYNAIAIYSFSQQDQTRKADCAIVAGAGITEKSPSPVFTARLDHAMWLYQEGKVNSLILTGGRSNGASESDAAIARHYLLNRGVPEAVIFIDEQSTVTRENIHNAKIIMARQHMQTALLVSDPLHMLRMRLIAYDNDMVSWSSPTTTSRYRSWQTQLPFLLREAFYYTGYRILRYLPAIPPENNAP